MLLSLVLLVLVVAVDQITKHLTVIYLPHPGDSVELIPGFLRLTYVQNPGAAFGSLTNARWVFMLCSTVLIVAIIWYYIRKKPQSMLVRAGLILVCGGGIGNMIDRIFYGYVIDMIDFYGIWQFVFNAADSCVCIGAGLLAVYCLIGIFREKQAQKASETAGADAPAEVAQIKETGESGISGENEARGENGESGADGDDGTEHDR